MIVPISGFAPIVPKLRAGLFVRVVARATVRMSLLIATVIFSVNLVGMLLIGINVRVVRVGSIVTICSLGPLVTIIVVIAGVIDFSVAMVVGKFSTMTICIALTMVAIAAVVLRIRKILNLSVFGVVPNIL
jgi:hypothetical protein